MAPENTGQQVPKGPDPLTAKSVKLFPTKGVDKKGRTRKGLDMSVDGHNIEYVRWDHWQALSEVIAKAAKDPEFGLGLADALQKAYIQHAADGNGSSQRTGSSLI